MMKTCVGKAAFPARNAQIVQRRTNSAKRGGVAEARNDNPARLAAQHLVD
jgi:hypothetical protein